MGNKPPKSKEKNLIPHNFFQHLVALAILESAFAVSEKLIYQYPR